MTYTYPKKYDVIVVGAGHAGCEAALVSSRMGLSTLLVTINLDTVAQMSCNTSIGGVAKGQIVKEIDALGGKMAINTDKTGIQFRILNRKKGPAVQSPRAQCDKKLYQFTMKQTIEKQRNLDLKQEETTKILTKNGKVTGILTRLNNIYLGKALIITTGTFLKGIIHIGESIIPAGRGGEFPANYLSSSLKELGFEIKRLKTGTPPRINRRSIDFSKLTEQLSDNPPVPFSMFTEKIIQPLLPCWIAYTNNTTHKIIQDNFHRAPLFSGQIKGIGPRYCPSIEDKIRKFPEKQRHQIFLEPEGYNTEEIYANGLATSLPPDVQVKMVRSVRGLEKAEIERFGYAIEYDFCPPTQLKPTLETKMVENLYFAGQINGTSGYEEAAGQGIMAGINACLKLKGEQPFILNRSQAYIGVLIDDLVTKGVMDPYRMFTSRAEYRLILRADNADLRLMEYGYKFGLFTKQQYKRFCSYKKILGKALNKAKKAVSPSRKLTFAQIIKRGEKIPSNEWKIDEKVKNEVEIELKYEGYIKRQLQEIEKFKKLEEKKIPDNINYDNIQGLLTEAKLKLKQIKPVSIGQASRISGVTPADIGILLVHLKKQLKKSKIQITKKSPSHLPSVLKSRGQRDGSQASHQVTSYQLSEKS